MKKSKNAAKRALALLLALSCILVIFAGCAKKEEEPQVEEIDPSTLPALTWDDNGVPTFKETFEREENEAQARGEVALEVIDREEGGKELHVSGRTDTWNGVNFPADVFAGNAIRAQADLMGADGSARLSLQYEMAGVPTYTWIITSPTPGKLTTVVGEIAIPEGAANVFVYVESDSLADLYVDNLTITVKGTYNKPKGAFDSYADYSSYEKLKDVYADKFMMGCAIPTSYVGNEQAADILNCVTQQFNAVTFENEFKPDGILDKEACFADPEKYNEAPAVKFDENLVATLDYCKENDIKVRGHVLIWHSQTPEWLFYENYDVSGEKVGRDLMLKRQENYIKSVLTWCGENYPGVFYAWDVVNEACDDSTNALRRLNWYNTIGPDYVETAFKFARKYAPEGVKLFYNDYNAYFPEKCEGIIEFLKPVAKAGNIDGVGMQGHINSTIDVQEFVDCAFKYVDELGVVLNVTELDIEMGQGKSAEYDQGVFYKKFFSALLEAKENGLPLEAVTVWGINDARSWKADKFPLLFNADLSKKPAFDGVVCAVTGEDVPMPVEEDAAA